VTTDDEQRWQDLAIQAGRVFSPSAPIDKRSLFAGRELQIRAVIDAINQKGQHAIIYGERGVGKTSLANVLASFLDKQPAPIVAPRVQCDALDTFPTVWRKVFDRIELTRSVTRFRFASDAIQETFKATELVGGDDISPDDVRRALTVLSKSALPIVIIDEFDRLPADRRRPFADTIKTLSDHAVPATVVLVGVAENVEALVEEHRSVERALVQVRMPRMSRDEIARIVTTGLEKLGMAIRPDALERLVVLSQGLPHYTHLVSLYAAREAAGARTLEVSVGHVNGAIDKAVTGAQESIASLWHQATRSARKDNLFADVLLACALAETDRQGTFAAQDVRPRLREIAGKPYTIASFAQHLEEFCSSRRGPVLQRTGAKRSFRYRFVNPLMQPYAIMQGYRSRRITLPTGS